MVAKKPAAVAKVTATQSNVDDDDDDDDDDDEEEEEEPRNSQKAAAAKPDDDDEDDDDDDDDDDDSSDGEDSADVRNAARQSLAVRLHPLAHLVLCIAQGPHRRPRAFL